MRCDKDAFLFYALLGALVLAGLTLAAPIIANTLEVLFSSPGTAAVPVGEAVGTSRAIPDGTVGTGRAPIGVLDVVLIVASLGFLLSIGMGRR